MTLREADNFINKINKQINNLIQFNGTISNPLLSPFTNALRAVNLDYKFRDGEIKISRSKDNLKKVDSFAEKLEQNHALSLREYKKKIKSQLQVDTGKTPTGPELMRELYVKRAVWNMQPNFDVIYYYTRNDIEPPDELKNVMDIPDKMRNSHNLTTAEIRELAAQVEDAINEYEIKQRQGALWQVQNGDAL